MTKPAILNRDFPRAASAALSVSWNAFVAAFLYYSLLAALALGGVAPGVPVVATAYLAPPIMYVVTILSRAVRAALAWVTSAAAVETEIRPAL